MNTLNNKIIEIVNNYPKDGTHQYHWNLSDSSDGVTEDLFYKGTRVAKSRPDKKVYCSGVMFEVWFKAVMANNMNLGTAQDVINIKRKMFIIGKELTGPIAALVPKFGKIVTLEEAQKGDLMQIWRKHINKKPIVGGKYTSGHSTIFWSKVNNGVEYFSGQTKTNGLGFNKEYFTGINPMTDLFIVRPYLI